MRKHQLRLIAAILLLILIPLAVFAVYTYRNEYQKLREKEIRDYSQLLIQSRTSIERILLNTVTAADSFSQASDTQQAMSMPMNGYQFELYSSLRKELLRLQPLDTVHTDACLINLSKNWIINNSGLHTYKELPNQDLYDQYCQGRGISGFFSSYLSDHPEAAGNPYDFFFSHDAVLLAKTLPLGRQNNITGLLLVKIPCDYLSRLLPAEDSGRTYRILDSDQRLLATNNPSDYGIRMDRDSVDDTQKVENLDVSWVRVDRNTYRMFSESDFNGWTFELEVDNPQFVPGYYAILFTIIGVSLLILAFAVLSAVLLSKRTYRPVDDLISRLNPEDYEKNQDPFAYISDSIDNIRGNYLKTLDEMSRQKQPMQEYLTIALLTGDINAEIMSAYQDSFFSTDGSDEMYVMILKPSSDLIREDIQSFGLLTSAMRKTIEQTLHQEYALTPVIIEHMVCIVMKNRNGTDYLTTARKVVQKIQHMIVTREDLPYTVGVGKLFHEIQDAAVSYQEASDALSYSILFQGETFLSYEEIAMNRSLRPQQYRTIQEKLIYSIKLFDRKNVEKYLNELFSSVFQYGLVRNEYIVSMCNLLTELIGICQEVKPDFSTRTEDGRSLYDELMDCGSQEEMKAWLYDRMINPYIEEESKLASSQRAQIVRKLDEMIEAGFDQNLTIEKCAEELNYHPAYLRKIFYEIHGKNFGDVIMEKKMEVSKKWLSETDMMVQEIAERLGYSNSQNFIRYFKAYVGETPGKYRDRMHNKNLGGDQS